MTYSMVACTFISVVVRYKLDCIDLQFDALPMGCTLYAMDIGTMKKTQHSECQRLLLFTMKALLDSVDADNGDFL